MQPAVEQSHLNLNVSELIALTSSSTEALIRPSEELM